MPTIRAIQYQANSADLFNKLVNLPYACWLDSGRPNSQRGRYDIMTALPQTRLVTVASNNTLETRIYKDSDDNVVTKSSNCPFALLKTALESAKDQTSHLPFMGGALGYWSYELGSSLLNVSIPEDDNAHLPDMAVGIYHWAIIQDHEIQEAYLANLDSCKPAILEQVNAALNQNPSNNLSFIARHIASTETEAHYQQNIQKVFDYIAAGDCYQVNYAQQFTGQYTGEPYGIYQHLREVMASPNSAYIDLGEQQAILSFSPERFIAVNNGEVLTQPIKGTAPRDKDPIIDKQYAEDLLFSEKNRAENLMIVDLLRNDLGKHCEPSSIKVPELFKLKSYPNVHHLVSNVSGKLKVDTSSVDLLRDSLPGGSITGAPKKRAMEIIQELEEKRRGIYCGSIGYINHQGDMDTNIAIRTVSCNKGTLSCWGGGGIVADSNAQQEYQETLDKVRMILEGLQASN